MATAIFLRKEKGNKEKKTITFSRYIRIPEEFCAYAWTSDKATGSYSHERYL